MGAPQVRLGTAVWAQSEAEAARNRRMEKDLWSRECIPILVCLVLCFFLVFYVYKSTYKHEMKSRSLVVCILELPVFPEVNGSLSCAGRGSIAS